MPRNDGGASWASPFPWDVKAQYDQAIDQQKQQYIAQNNIRRGQIAEATARKFTEIPAADKQLTKKYEEWSKNVNGVIERYNGRPHESLAGAQELTEAQRPFADNTILTNANKTKENYKALMEAVKANTIDSEQFAKEKARYEKMINSADFETEFYEFIPYNNTPASERFKKISANYKETVIEENSLYTKTGHKDDAVSTMIKEFDMNPDDAKALNEMVMHRITTKGAKEWNALDPDEQQAYFEEMRWDTVRNQFLPLRKDLKERQYSGSGKGPEDDWNLHSSQAGLPPDHAQIAKLAKVGSSNVLPAQDFGFGPGKEPFGLTDFGGKIVLTNGKSVLPGAGIAIGEGVASTEDVAMNYMKKIDKVFEQAGISNAWSTMKEADPNGLKKDPEVVDAAMSIPPGDNARAAFERVLGPEGLNLPITVDQLQQMYTAGDFSPFGNIDVRGTIYPAKSKKLNGAAILYYMISQVAQPFNVNNDTSGLVAVALQGVRGLNSPNGLVKMSDLRFNVDSDVSSREQAMSTVSGQTQQKQKASLNNVRSGVDDYVPHGKVPDGKGSLDANANFNQTLTKDGRFDGYVILDNTEGVKKSIKPAEAWQSPQLRPMIEQGINNIRHSGTTSVPEIYKGEKDAYRSGNAVAKYLRVKQGSKEGQTKALEMFGAPNNTNPWYLEIQAMPTGDASQIALKNEAMKTWEEFQDVAKGITPPEHSAKKK